MSHTGYALGVNCGITFAGLKPASLFWLRDEQCTDMPYYRRLFGKRDFRFITVRSVRGRKLYYVFNRKMLQSVLSDPNIGKFLRSRGYSDTSLGGALGELRRRLEGEGDFPHEVGLFLGYPLEDVEGFIRDARGGICLSCGYWKVYGCPAMGSEELEEGEFEPFFASAEGKLGGKKIGLFGSYEWAEGEWMRTWQARAEADGAVMLAEGLAVCGTPDEDGLEKCRALGRLAANASA